MPQQEARIMQRKQNVHFWLIQNPFLSPVETQLEKTVLDFKKPHNFPDDTLFSKQ